MVGNPEVDLKQRASETLSESASATKSPDVTLAYLKGKDAESEEAQEHVNGSSMAQ